MAKAKPAKAMTEAQLAYESKRAAKAGMSVERWLDQKRKTEAAEEAERVRAAAPSAAPKKPGFLSRLIDRAHKPL